MNASLNPPLKRWSSRTTRPISGCSTRHLRTEGLAAECTRVASNAELETALAAPSWTLALADYQVPGMDFESTLAQIRARWPELPIILLSGTVGEERAVELLHAGSGILSSRIT